MFSISPKILINAEKNKKSLIPSSVIEIVRKNQEVAKYAGKAFKTATASTPSAALTDTVTNDGDRSNSNFVNGDDFVSATKFINTDAERSADSISNYKKIEDNYLNYDSNNDLVDKFFAGIGDSYEEEFADPEQTCSCCLPVYGDTIIGIKQPGESTPMICRIGCMHAQRAMNKASFPRKEMNFQGSVNSKSLREAKINQFNSKMEIFDDDLKSDDGERDYEVPVRLCWPVYLPDGEVTCLVNGNNQELQQPGRNGRGDFNYYLTEVVVHAKDRKLLLADCSEVVSELSEIVKSGSASSNEHATLIFLVKVNGLAHLQKLMDTLLKVRAVMSVERKFGSDLL